MPLSQNKNKHPVLVKSSRFQQAGRIRPVWLLIAIFWVAILVVMAANQQRIWDWWQLRNYTAPSQVVSLADQDKMTPYARKIFYVNKPDIRSKSHFTSVCPNNGGEQTIVLGCYHGGQKGIFLLQVSDSRLSGVQQVTAAHEMLHGAYDRLSPADRQHVDKLLNDYYAHGLNDDRIMKTIDAYKKTEPKDVTNEMHSIFATEVGSLPTELNDYYKKYFTDRAKVVAYAAQYQQEFSSRQATITQDDAQLKTLKSQIDTLEAQLHVDEETITKNQATLNGLRANGDATSYNAAVPAYNQMVRNYNANVDRLHTLVEQYNQLVASRNSVAGEIDTLVKDLTPQASSIQ